MHDQDSHNLLQMKYDFGLVGGLLQLLWHITWLELWTITIVYFTSYWNRKILYNFTLCGQNSHTYWEPFHVLEHFGLRTEYNP
jgi:hypothetical protein